MSLLYTMQALDARRYHPIVALIRPTPPVVRLYRDAGFEVIEWPGILTLEHTTLHWWPIYSPRALLDAARLVAGWRGTQARTRALVEQVRPDLVHLNSVVLAPSALALRDQPTPFVWHVREPAAAGHLGLRRSAIGGLLRTLGHEVLFICEDDRQSWVRGKRGRVVYNFVNFEQFYPGVDGSEVRERLGIADDAKVILFVGGLSRVKGIELLLRALPALCARYPKLVCLMPGVEVRHPRRLITRAAQRVRSALGERTPAQLWQQLRVYEARGHVRILPYQTDIAPYIAASDMLLFPALRPHFARPVIEAAAMGKPAVGTNVGGVRELISDGVTGLLTEPGSAPALAAAIGSLLDDPALAQRLGEQAAQRARQRFDAARNIRQIEDVYATALQSSPHASAGARA